MKLSPQVLLLSILTLFAGSGANAVVVAQYGFDGNSLASQVSVAGATPGDVIAGPSVPENFTTQGNPGAALEFSFGTVGANLGQSVTDGDYYSFTVTPVNAELTFNQFDFEFYKSPNAGANVQAVLFSSLDGFTVGDEIGLGQLTGTGDSGSFEARSISLASLPSDLTAPVEFRLYIHDSNASNQANNFRLDNLSLDADVTLVPEPSTGLLALLALPFLTRRQRK